MVAHTARPVADLSTDWEDLARPDLAELLQQWQQERQYVAEPRRVRQLDERLATAWAIESGIFGRPHTIRRETIDALAQGGRRAVERLRLAGGIPENDARQIQSQRAAFDFAVDARNLDRPLTVPFVRELQQRLTRSQTQSGTVDPSGATLPAEADRQSWDRLPSTPTPFEGPSHADRPPDGIWDEVDRLVETHRRHLASGVPPEVEAAWLHQRFRQLDQVFDSDGRLAHTLATIVFLEAGCIPLVIRDDLHREAYLDTLGEADGGDLKPLVDLFANVVSADLNDAITFVRAAHGRDIGAIAAAAANAARRCAVHDERGLRLSTDHYRKVAGAKLRDVAGQLNRAFEDAFPRLPSEQHAWIVADDLELKMSTGARGRWREQIVRAADVYHYSPDLGQYKRWVALKLPRAAPDVQCWQVVVSLHHKESRAGVMAAVLFLTTSDDADAGTSADVARPTILGAKREFTHSGNHPHDDRFVAWLNAALTAALEEWQARI